MTKSKKKRAAVSARQNPSADHHAAQYRHNLDRSLLYLDFAYRNLVDSRREREEGERRRLAALACESAYDGLAHLEYAQMEDWNLEDDGELWSQTVEPTLDMRSNVGRFFGGLLHVLGCPPPTAPDVEELAAPGALEKLYAKVQAQRPAEELAKEQQEQAEAEDILESVLSGEPEEGVELVWAPGHEPNKNPLESTKRRLLAYDFE
jgi:nucleotide-binding universal stress UspA family protein